MEFSSIAQRVTQNIFQSPAAPAAGVKSAMKAAFNSRYDTSLSMSGLGLKVLEIMGVMLATALSGGLFLIAYAIKQGINIEKISLQDDKEAALIKSVYEGIKKAIEECPVYANKLEFEFEYEGKIYTYKLRIQDNELHSEIGCDGQWINVETVENFSYQNFTESLIKIKQSSPATDGDANWSYKFALAIGIPDSDGNPAIKFHDISNTEVIFTEKNSTVEIFRAGSLTVIPDMTLLSMQKIVAANTHHINDEHFSFKRMLEVKTALGELHTFTAANWSFKSDLVRDLANKLIDTKIDNQTVSFTLEPGIEISYTQTDDDVIVKLNDVPIEKLSNKKLETLSLLAGGKVKNTLAKMHTWTRSTLAKMHAGTKAPVGTEDSDIGELIEQLSTIDFVDKNTVKITLKNGMSIGYNQQSNNVLVNINGLTTVTLNGKSLEGLRLFSVCQTKVAIDKINSLSTEDIHQWVSEERGKQHEARSNKKISPIEDKIMSQLLEVDIDSNHVARIIVQNGIAASYVQNDKNISVMVNGWTIATLVNKKLEELPLFEAAIKMKRAQAVVRGFYVRNYKATPLADVAALRDSKKNILAYRVGKDTATSFPYKRLPEKVTDPEIIKKLPRGSSKAVTHVELDGDKFVGEYLGITQFLPDQPKVCPKVIGVILDQELETMVLQKYCDDIPNEGPLLMTPNLGRDTLQDLHLATKYQYQAADFKPLAQDIDVFHSEGFVHGDIKPGNMLVEIIKMKGDSKGVRVVLTDHNSAGRPGFFPVVNGGGSPAYIPQAYSVTFIDNNSRGADINPYKKDQYAFFISMMQCQFNQFPTGPGRFNDHENKVAEFIKSLPCSDRKQQEVKYFLTDPVSNKLSRSLAEYL